MEADRPSPLPGRDVRLDGRRLIPLLREEPKRIDLIWNSTLVCPFDCGKCCVGAVHVKARDGNVLVSTNDLSTYSRIGSRPNEASGSTWPYEVAARARQREGLELDLAGKLRVLNHLDGLSPKIDISGGDPLVLGETMTLIRAAAERFGRESVTVTATGVGLKLVSPADLAPYVHEVNITFDGTPPKHDPLCPNGYAIANLREAVRLADHGISIRAEIPLTLQNIHASELEKIYRALAATRIRELLVMRLFPVGRGELRERDIPSAEQYRTAIAFLRSLEMELRGPRVKLQCALRHLDGATMGPNPCDAVRESFGLMADGTLLASPWAINRHGRPIDDLWVLGNLAATPMLDILRGERVAQFLRRADANFGHCKIFSSLYGRAKDPIDRVAELADPLYIGEPADEAA